METLTDEELEAREARRIAGIEASMAAEGESLTEQAQDDYFGVDVIHRVVLPDGKSYIEHKELSEGERRKYLNDSNRDVRFQKATGDALVKMKPGDERHALLEAAICGWNLVRRGEPIAFSSVRLTDWLRVAPPRVVDLVFKDIYKHNPWLLQNMTVEDIEKEIENLTEMLETKRAEEEGKAGS